VWGDPRAEVIFQHANIARKAHGLDLRTREQAIATDFVRERLEQHDADTQ